MNVRWTKQLIPTLREVPQEAEIPSHKLMLRSGLIRKLSAGLYTFLPLGRRALKKVETIVREEMDRAGALEVLMPAMQPREIWERTGRYSQMKDVMFNIVDRQERGLVLGPTHEEVVTDLVSREVNSYKQLPLNLYQVQTKFRDEIRPRFGLMRAKEFIMKDAYSFDATDEGANQSYQAMYDAYVRIFHRCGLRTKVVEADTGAMGGSSSHEFMVLADSGEDGIVECEKCDYAANLEKAEARLNGAPTFDDADKALQEIDTPGMGGIDDVAKFLKTSPARLIKTLIYLVDGQPTAVLAPGDRAVNEIKLARALKADTVELADDGQIREITGAPVGFAGPVGLSIPIRADSRLKGYRGAVTGANKADTHLVHVDLDRDAKVTGYDDFTTVMDGDHCPRCDGTLREKRGVEVGHVFKLGTKYSESLSATFLDAEGETKPAIMGCYGIGVTRTLQAVIEQSHDKDGIIWPASVSPYEIEVLPLNIHHEESVQVADQIAASLSEAGISVLYDDRDERPGVKFKDADLVGVPIRIAVGEKSLAKGVVEIKLRRDADVRPTEVDQAVKVAKGLLEELLAETSV